MLKMQLNININLRGIWYWGNAFSKWVCCYLYKVCHFMTQQVHSVENYQNLIIFYIKCIFNQYKKGYTILRVYGWVMQGTKFLTS